MEALTTNLAAIWPWLLKATLQGSLLVCLIVLIKMILRERLPARWHYALWLVLLLRLALPWTPQSRISIYGLIPRSVPLQPVMLGVEGAGRSQDAVSKEGLSGQGRSAGGPVMTDQAKTMQPVKGTTVESKPVELSVSKGASSDGASSGLWLKVSRVAGFVACLLPWLWLAGALSLTGYILIRSFRLWRAVRSERPVTDQRILDHLEDCKMQMRIQTIVAVVVTDKIRTPVLFGFLRPRILLPQGLVEAIGLDNLEYVFLHELAHLKRHDIYMGWMVSLVQVLHWFNPLVWLAFGRMRMDQETAADALALSRLTGEEPAQYGQTIMKLLEGFTQRQLLPSVAGILEDTSHIERRIEMISRFDLTPRRPLVAMVVLAVLGLITLTDAQNQAARQPQVGAGSAASENAPVTPQAAAAGAADKTIVTGDSNVFVDGQTGIRFTKFKTISGPSDVIEGSAGLNLSPNGKFLLWMVRVVPLDGSVPFDLVDMPNAYSGSWSPDGRKVLFHAKGIWLIDVDPETGRPTGSARRLLEQEDKALGPPLWSSDSMRIVFRRYDRQVQDQISALSIQNGDVSQVTDPFSLGIVSPDGKMVACSEGQGIRNQNALLVKPVAGGEARKIIDGVYPVVWSADSEWLVCKPRVGGGWKDLIRFVHMTDGREVKVDAPGYMIRQSPQGRKLLFYYMSYDYQNVLRVISVAGGPSAKLGGPSMSFGGCPGYQSWSRDARSIFVDKGGDRGLWVVPLDGKAPQSLTIDIPLRPADSSLFSPDNGKLLLIRDTRAEEEAQKAPTFDLWVTPISLSHMRSTGSEVRVFGGAMLPSSYWSCDPPAWSPDSTKIAFCHKMDIWVASADGKSSVQLTETSEVDRWPDWSPDGTKIAFASQSPPSYADTVIRVVPASGGAARVITGIPFRYGDPQFFAWSPDGNELTIASEPEGTIFNIPISGGDARTVLRVKDKGITHVGRLRWSPDGRLLGFIGTEGGEEKIYIYHLNNSKLDRFDGCDTPWYWSPDNKWISFFSEDESVKTRPEGILWEMDIEEALAKLTR